MLIVAERINSSRKHIAQAIKTENTEFIKSEAKAQAAAGADFIDINAGTFVGEEIERLTWLIEIVNNAVETPICLDSPDPKVIEAALPLVRNSPVMINSITLDPHRLETLLPLVAEHKAKVIALCQSETDMAETADEKVKMAEALVERVTEAGISIGDLYIDPLVYPVSTKATSALDTLEAIERIMHEFTGVHTICGLTNVSYGLPSRKLVNRTFLVAAISRGLDAVILDPTDSALYGALKAGQVIAGKDEYCLSYITDFRNGRFE